MFIVSKRCLVILIVLLGFTSPVLSQTVKGLVKVISYNIWNGFTGKDTTRHDRFTQWVIEKDPDVLALQELVGYSQEKLAAHAAEWGHSYAFILKESGYPVGITSKYPIELKEKLLDEMWHGMLHAKVLDIEFFVIHLSPADYEFRFKEANILKERIKNANKENKNVIVLGDFNSMSPTDADFYTTRDSLKARYVRGDARGKNKNLLLGEFDYSVISTFLSVPLIDPAPDFIKPEGRYTFPAPALVGIWQTAEEIIRNKQRIDYILLSPELANGVVKYKIYHDNETGSLSDHYPVELLLDRR